MVYAHQCRYHAQLTLQITPTKEPAWLACPNPLLLLASSLLLGCMLVFYQQLNASDKLQMHIVTSSPTVVATLSYSLHYNAIEIAFAILPGCWYASLIASDVFHWCFGVKRTALEASSGRRTVSASPYQLAQKS